MVMIDTHTHLYLEQFDDDRTAVVQRALDAGVQAMLLPNIDSKTIQPMLALCDAFPQHVFPMIGLHPTDVKENYEQELEIVKQQLAAGRYIAIGEIGIDLYWDKTWLSQQQLALEVQVQMAIDYRLPIVLHVRDSFDEVFEIIGPAAGENLTGVFHCFTGNREQAEKIIGWGFKLGVGGMVTYKNSGLAEVFADVDLQHLLLETDAPFLAPVPHRGKRNESAYLTLIATKLAEIKNVSVGEVARVTSQSARELFKIKTEKQKK
ncbi:MAG TPA: TatD family hydrolase [Bacteroidales bacterium]|nr:TatD family hydrolase [Bacteroidales bacterium]